MELTYDDKWKSFSHANTDLNLLMQLSTTCQYELIIDGIGPAKDGGNLAAEIKAILGWLGKDGDGLGNCKGWVYGF